jgi:hypothetical protein
MLMRRCRYFRWKELRWRCHASDLFSFTMLDYESRWCDTLLM